MKTSEIGYVLRETNIRFLESGTMAGKGFGFKASPLTYRAALARTGAVEFVLDFFQLHRVAVFVFDFDLQGQAL